MAVVPRPQNRVGTRAVPLAGFRADNASPAAFGALTGQALENLGEGLQTASRYTAAIVQKANEENIKRDAKNLYNEYNTFLREQAYGDGTSENPGFLGQNGEDAIKGFPVVQKAITDKKKELLGRTNNRYVQEAFGNAAAVAEDSALSTMLQHTNRQREVANDAASNALINSAISDGALAWNDPNTVNRSLMLVENETRDQAARKGLSAEATEALVKAARGKFYESTITAANQFNNEAARKLFEQHEAEIDGVSRAVLEQRLDAKFKQDINDRQSNERFNAWRDNEFKQANFNQAVAKAATGELTKPQIVDMITKGRISGEQGENLFSFLDRPTNLNGSQEASNRLRYQLYRGFATMEDVMKEPSINGKEREELLGVADTIERNGGIWSRNDVKLAVDYIEDIAGGPKGLLGELTGDGAQRVANALDQFHKSLVFMPPEQRTAAAVEQLKNEVANAYRPSSAAGAAELNTLPPLPGMSQGKIYSKAELRQIIEATEEEVYRTWTSRDPNLDSGMLAQELNKMADLLDKYYGAWSRMNDDIARPTNQGK